jgi:hypothetical protein
MKASASNKDIAATYISESFSPADRLAVVLLNKRTGAVIQRMAAAEKMTAPDFQEWLRYKNAGGLEVYISMNALHALAEGRTKADVAVIRHVFLDFDQDGTAAVQKLLARDDLPKPNSVISTSPDKWQVVWQVEGFNASRAEKFQRAFAREAGADIAATDCARVLRLPGFYNHKYSRPHLVDVERLTSEIYGPERFPDFPADERRVRASLSPGRSNGPREVPQTLSQSERDWAYAKRALMRGESDDVIIAAIATHRRFEKHDPQYYAELTVRKATEAVRSEFSVREKER